MQKQSLETLTFWTARGVASWLCQLAVDDAGLVTIMVSLPPAKAGAAHADIVRRNGHAAALPKLPPEVGRDAWLAHELRTPLSAIIAYAELLKDEHFGPLGSTRYRGYARDIHEGARHALGVVDSMLRGHPVREPAALSFCDLDLTGIVESCLAVVRPLAERAGLEMGMTCTPRLPRIVADERTLKQMLLNLLANAVKFARPGDRVTVTVAYDGAGPLRLSVVDTGPGMAGGKGAEPAATSLGLGLPLSRALAAANGASLDIASAPGQGTCVTISFAEDRVVPV
jgi:signal transduction histidine kinase